jgi:S-adenosylmethionine:tRNA ribosyltransferase-isomerase
MKVGQFLRISGKDGKSEGFQVLEKTPEGTAWLQWQGQGLLNQERLDEIGLPPLPPYIRRNPDGGPELSADRQAYQTVYARQLGSAAAPTAGLHFTPHLLDKLQGQGIGIGRVTLHVGLGTFLPVKEDDPTKHWMHREDYELGRDTIALIERTRAKGGRVVCVGTTSVRVLESACLPEGILKAGQGSTRLFIRPGFSFRTTQGLVTNFHFPKSTLLMLVAAFAGLEKLLALYEDCLTRGYRFLSYGDAMLVL